MAYATLADLAQYLPPGPLSQVTTAQQSRALADASAEADTALGNQYDLPLVGPFPPDLIVYVCKLATANLVSFTGVSTENGANQWVVDYRKDALAYFAGVANGTRTPSGIIDSSPTVRTGGARVYSQPSRGWSGPQGSGNGGFWGT